MKLARAAFLVFCCFADIQILSAEAVFYPAKCWGKKDPCAVENDSSKSLHLESKGLVVHLSAKSVLKKIDGQAADLARGTMFAKAEGEFRWHSPFGDVVCKNCEVILNRDENSLEIHAIHGDVAVQRKGDSSKYDLPPGFSVLLSTVRPDGKGDLDFPQASALRPLLKSWAKVYPGDADQFKKDVGAYMDYWREAVEVSSDMERKEADRVIASAASEEARIEALRKARWLEDQKLRQLFREKNNF